MSFKKILVPVDFSGPSHDAMQVAAGLAVESKGELMLVHVWQAPVYTAGNDTPLPQSIIDDVIAASKRLLVEWAAEAEKLGVRSVTTELRTGPPWHEIVELVRRDPTFDLIVVGTHGRTGIKHALLGSVAEKVVRHASCPVLAVRPR